PRIEPQPATERLSRSRHHAELKDRQFRAVQCLNGLSFPRLNRRGIDLPVALVPGVGGVSLPCLCRSASRLPAPRSHSVHSRISVLGYSQARSAGGLCEKPHGGATISGK